MVAADKAVNSYRGLITVDIESCISIYLSTRIYTMLVHAIFSYHVYHMNIETVFLNGKPIGEIYTTLSESFIMLRSNNSVINNFLR